MKALRHTELCAFLVLLAVLLTACSGMTDQGSPTTTTNQGSATATNQGMNNGTPTSKTTPTTNGNMNSGTTMNGITITPDTTGDMAAFIRTGKAVIDGKNMNVLLTNKGFAIYYYKADATLTSTCTGQCAKDWPPVLVPQGAMVSSSAMLPKQLSVHQSTNGMQVFYDGHALYTYAEDKKAGQATGHGADMDWYLVDTMMSSMASMNNGNMNTPVATTTPTGNGSMNSGGMTQGITVTPNMMGNMAAFIHTGKAAINGSQVSVLLTSKNFAIYYYTDDTAFTSTCTGQCAKDWPPVLAPQGMMTVSSSVTLPKKLSVHQTANGAQVFYDGHALYTYAEDKQTGQATGRGQDKQWYLVGSLL